MDPSLFLGRLRGKSTPDLFKLPIEEGLCYQGLCCAFEKVVEQGYHRHLRNREQQYVLSRVASWLVAPRQRWGLFINGIPGNGKTTTLYAIRRIFNALELRDPLAPSNEIRTAGLWIKTAGELNELYLKDRKQFERYKTTAFLGIDELGAEQAEISSYGNVYMPLVEVLSYRYQNRMFTVLTTNLPNSSLRPKYGDRISDRLNEMMNVLTMPDIDFRNQQGYPL